MDQFKFLQHKKDALEQESFLEWFGKSKVTYDNGHPIIVYHGTTYDIKEFDPNLGQADNYFGKGIYTTDSGIDVNNNYASMSGPDLKNKISNSFNEIYSNVTEEQMIQLLDKHSIKYAEDEDIYNEEIVHELAEKMHTGDSKGFVMPLYLSIQNPIYINASGTIFDCDYEIDEDFESLKNLLEVFLSNPENTGEEEIDAHSVIQRLNDAFLDGDIEDNGDAIENITESLEIEFWDEDLVEPTKAKLTKEINKLYDINENTPVYYNSESELVGSLVDFFDNLREVLCENDCNDSTELVERIMEQLDCIHPDSEMTALDLMKKLHDIDSGLEINDWLPLGYALRLTYEKMGYDGIIMSANELIPQMQMDHETNHYIAFNGNQCKSALGNNGEYSKLHNDICARISDKNSKERISEQDAINLTKEIDKKLNGRLNIKATKISEAPQDIIDELNQRNINLDDIKGYMLNRTCYLFIDNINNEDDLLKTLVHESFHLGIKDLLGHRANKVYSKIYDYLAKEDSNALAEVAKTHNLDLTKRKDQLIAVDESMAIMAEEGIPEKVSTIIIGAVRSFLRSIKIDMEINKTDVDYLVSRSLKKVNTDTLERDIKQTQRRKI